MNATTLRLLAGIGLAALASSLLPLSGAGAVAGFGDVPSGAFYATAVQWLDDESITTGTSEGCFSPDRAVTRGEFATFLWRHAGEPAGGAEPFTDVNSSDFFRNAVAWMANTGITTGTSPATFHPQRAVTRGEAATFLWRHAGEPTGGAEPFTDVNNGDFFRNAVAWMANTDITTGTSPTTFHPQRAVTRGETATFLWRYAGSPGVTVEAGGICGETTTTTTAPPTTTTTAPPSGGTYFATLPPGATLPSGEWCAARIKPAPETRTMNTTYNNTRGTTPNDRYPRANGDFTGTTDEIIQWAACKWGIDEDIARAQAAKESWWDMRAGGDTTSNQSACHPDLRTTNGQDCPESIGLLQVRYLYHLEAFEDTNAIASTAYNADYTWAIWRDCYDGNLTWLNNVERGATYTAGDLDGCLGVWFSGRWRTQRALDYIDAVNDLHNQRIWEQPNFLNY